MNLVMGYWDGEGGRTYHHTAPVNSMYGLHESLVILKEIGLENSWAKHAFHHEALAAGIEAMGLGFVVDKEYRLPQLNSVTIPEGLKKRRSEPLLNDYNLEIGAGLGALAGKVWRIGLMGELLQDQCFALPQCAGCGAHRYGCPLSTQVRLYRLHRQSTLAK